MTHTRCRDMLQWKAAPLGSHLFMQTLWSDSRGHSAANLQGARHLAGAAAPVASFAGQRAAEGPFCAR